MSPSPVLSVIHTVTFGTMLNFKDGNNGHGLKNVTCKQTLKLSEETFLQRNFNSLDVGFIIGCVIIYTHDKMFLP